MAKDDVAVLDRATRWRRRGRRALKFGVVAMALVGLGGLLIPNAPRVGNFRSAEGRQAYVDAYKQVLAQIPEPTSTLDLSTSFGTVRAYEWSTPDTADDAPVVLLPGRTSGTPMWRDNLLGLIGKRRIVALDTLGDAGMSVQSVPLTTMADQAAWLDEALRTISPDQPVHLVGHSFGGATAASVARAHPDRIATLTLLEPVFTLSSPPPSVYLWATILLLPTPDSWRDTAMAKIGGTEQDPSAMDDPLAQMIDTGSRQYSAALPTPKVLNAEELSELTMPVYVAIADHSSLAGGKDAAQNAKDHLPQSTVKIWPDTTHSLPMQVPDQINAAMLKFWEQN